MIVADILQQMQDNQIAYIEFGSYYDSDETSLLIPYAYKQDVREVLDNAVEAVLDDLFHAYEAAYGYQSQGVILRLHANGRFERVGTAYVPEPDVLFDYDEHPAPLDLRALADAE